MEKDTYAVICFVYFHKCYEAIYKMFSNHAQAFMGYLKCCDWFNLLSSIQF